MDSTTQDKKKNKDAKEDPADQMDPFEKELYKKIRNKQKKLDGIKDLETKVKKKEINANEEQLNKISSKVGVENEIKEINNYLDMYRQFQPSQANKVKDMKKQHQKDLNQARIASVRMIANMIVMHTMLESGEHIPEELEEGIRFFSEVLAQLLNNGDEPVHLRKERDNFINHFNKLVTNSKEKVPHTDITYDELGVGVSDFISSSDFPDVIQPKKQAQVAQVVQEGKRVEKKVEEKERSPVVQAEERPDTSQAEGGADDELAAMAGNFADAFGDSDDDRVEQAAHEKIQAELAERGAPKEEGKEDGGAEAEGNGEAPETGEDGEKGNRGGRGGRGDRRGNWRGNRGGRGGRGGRGNWRGNANFDNEGFEVVQQDGFKQRGRGRGYRGNRGNRGNFGGDGDNGEWRETGEGRRGNGGNRGRGGRGGRGRGERGGRPRRGGEGEEGDQETVDAQAQPQAEAPAQEEKPAADENKE